jgi:hypothetical protein
MVSLYKLLLSRCPQINYAFRIQNKPEDAYACIMVCNDYLNIYIAKDGLYFQCYFYQGGTLDILKNTLEVEPPFEDFLRTFLFQHLSMD